MRQTFTNIASKLLQCITTVLVMAVFLTLGAGSALATLFISRGGSFPRYGDASVRVNAIDDRLEEDS